MTDDQQTQLPIPGPPAVLRVVEDYGPVGSGASGAHTVLAENGEEYIVKGRRFAPTHPHVAGNEYIAARLAQAIGLPTLDARILDLAGEQLFAASWMSKGTFYPQTNAELFSRCENCDRIYDLVVFDTWIANVDRHSANLLVRQTKPRGEGRPRHHLLCNDHSHCLVLPTSTASQLAGQLESPPARHVLLDFVIAAITESARLAEALDRVLSIPSETVDAVFAEMPATFVPSSQEAMMMRDYLLKRRAGLADLFRKHRATFHRLDGGAL